MNHERPETFHGCEIIAEIVEQGSQMQISPEFDDEQLSVRIGNRIRKRARRETSCPFHIMPHNREHQRAVLPEHW
ncbi:hypothetical protein [Geomobilimonas luticola]|uniref:Uncharacterized protein n=1 Tax=Geomobilimonas luticola TaxID=1114878 RepID=A0ABS5S9J8_9BACT|nr:hypothetical protein [Geomobilimonas luticola]MBT0652046.1 hypothetical protein [Geomobilimonas luticola]